MLFLVFTLLLSPVHADDSAFLREIAQAGITHNGPSSAVAAAHAVCELAATESSTDVLQAVMMTNPRLTHEKAARFITLAAIHYCPEEL